MAIIPCSKQKPWNGKSDPGDQILHVDAVELGIEEVGWPYRDGWVTYQCPHCGHRWKQELPQ
jgi:hypothetical protein